MQSSSANRRAKALPNKPNKNYEPKQVTFEVTQVSHQRLCSNGGVILPPLMTKGRIRPEQVTKARFQLVGPHSLSESLSDQQFDALIKRLIKCFMSEVAITKKLRKLTANRNLQSADLLLIHQLELFRNKYETERTTLVTKLSLDHRFNKVSLHSAEKLGRHHAILPRSLASSGSSTSENEFFDSQEKRETGGALAEMSYNLRKHIVTPLCLSKSLQQKLDHLQQAGKQKAAASKWTPANDPQRNLVTSVMELPVKSNSSSDIFYDCSPADDFLPDPSCQCKRSPTSDC